MVDAERVRLLAELRGTSESEAVREAVDRLLFAEEFMQAIQEIRDEGGIDDVFGRLPESAAT
jgi:Arc/MetJ-type ribon-helix-helix transcriptional regulator